MLKKEGIVFSDSGRTNLAIFGWSGPPDGWRPPFDDPAPEKKRYVAGKVHLG
ncbi:MAG: hypothetical protein AAFV29_17685 [Myxococcota bacterium]